MSKFFGTPQVKGGKLSYRNYWSSVLGISDNVVENETEWKGVLSDNKDLTRKFLGKEWVKHLRIIYKELTSRRNQINHAGFVSRANVDELVGPFKDIVDRCLEFLESGTSITGGEKARCLFINYSNHPSKDWSDNQRKAALEYGEEIIDIPFYNVEPSKLKVCDIAENECKKILEYGECSNLCVHVMGEMTLAFAIVSVLKSRGVKCLASTTERIVHPIGDCKKEVEFDFVRFREY